MVHRPASIIACVSVAAGIALAACTTKEPQQTTYFERTIAPVLTASCVRTNTGAGCHVADDKGNAFGNLDLKSFDGLNHRRDLLLDYGPYGQPALLVKNVPPFTVQVQAFDGTKVAITTDIKHTGGPILDPTAGAYQTLRRWIDNGATANNTGTTPPSLVRLACTSVVPSAPGFDPTVEPTRPDFATFRDRVGPIIQSTCSASNCHGTSSNELYLTCGDSPEQIRWNYFVASQYLSQTAEQSEIVRRPLAPDQGGSFHEGGIIFPTTSDPGYVAFLDWANEHGPLDPGVIEPGFDFFAHRVQPMLVKKGCMMVQCHSAAMFHDYRLRGGSGGSFSLLATRKNYTLTLAQLALESPEVNASRLVRKNLYRPEVFETGSGIAHRGGPLLEDFAGTPASGAACDALKLDYDKGDLDDPNMKAYCVIREWHRRERASLKLGELSAIAYVKRSVPGGQDRAQDFDVYAPGAELHVVGATLSPTGDVVLVPTSDKSLNTACGLDAASADIKRPTVSWDGKTIAFAARASAGDSLQVYTVGADGTGCAKQADVNAGAGATAHNFDPVFSPPDATGVVRLVFASTRGNLATDPYDYSGPQRTPADPTKPNANLYVLEPDPNATGKTRIRQGTFLLNMERYPSFMSDGRLIFSTEKRAPGFYQLALRRMNLDGGDYHPLYAQRGSIGYNEARQVVELADKNFAAIFSDKDSPHGGGTLGVFNRSIGIDFTSTDPADYPVDSTVIDPNAPSSPEPTFFLHSLRFPDASVSGHATAPSTGVYASPAPLPNGRMLVSFGAANTAGSFAGDYDVYVLDPATGQKTKLFGDAGKAEVEAVAVYARAPRGVFASTLDEPNGHTTVLDGKPEADITILDMPVLASLLFQNTPTGRLVESATSFYVYEDLPPEANVTSFDAGGTNVVSDAFGKVYVRRRMLGSAPIAQDGSAHVVIPGGLPIVLRLPDTTESKAHALPRYQREEMEFAPGEYVHQSFRRDFFNGLCGNCHGAISGHQVDVAVQPDILTQASQVSARDQPGTNLNLPPSQRGGIEGPPATP